MAKLNKQVVEFKVTKDQMDEINLVREKTFSVYNFHRAMMIVLVKEMARDKWIFSQDDPIKVEFDPESLMVKVSIDELKESI